MCAFNFIHFSHLVNLQYCVLTHLNFALVSTTLVSCLLLYTGLYSEYLMWRLTSKSHQLFCTSTCTLMFHLLLQSIKKYFQLEATGMQPANTLHFSFDTC